MKKTAAISFAALFIAIVLVPNVTLAAWWNPFTWGFIRTTSSTSIQVRVATSTKGTMATSTKSAAVAPSSPKTSSTIAAKPIVSTSVAPATHGVLTIQILDPKYQEQYQIKLLASSGDPYLLTTVLGKSVTEQTETVSIPSWIKAGTYFVQVTQITNAGRCPNEVCAIGKSNPIGISSIGTYSPQIEPIILVQAPAVSTVQPAAVQQAPDNQLYRDLGVGDQGSDVKLLQAFLQARGYFSQNSNSISGSFGADTQSAVSRYQSSVGISANGYVGPSTRAAINGTIPSVQTTINTLIINQTNTFNQTINQTNQTLVVAPTIISSCPPGYVCSPPGSQVATPTPTPVPYVKPALTVTLTANGQKAATIGGTSLTSPIQRVTLSYQSQSAVRCVRVGAGTTEYGTSWDNNQTQTSWSLDLYSDYLPVGVSTFGVTCYDSAGTAVADSVTVTVNPLPDVSCPQSTNLVGTTYTLEPCNIDMSMVDGQGDRAFSFKIIPSLATSSYSFQVYGYGVGLPTYAILGVSSGGAWGTTSIDAHFSDKILSANGNQPRIYNGYLPVDIIDDKGNSGHLYFKVKVTVTPAQ